ncbi:MAG: hypothetical protein QOE63_1321 [Acidimicrobiaceae bacterium]
MLLLAACGGGAAKVTGSASSASSSSSTTTSASTTSTTATTTTTSVPPATGPVTTAATVPADTTPPGPEASDVAFVTPEQLGASWHAGCPVGPDQLRLLSVTYWGFDGAAHQGQLVVNVTAVGALRSVFQQLLAAQFPVRKVVTIDAYGGSDDLSAADDNTSAFNCREAVRSDGVHAWSVHAYGLAIDVNDVENPYVDGDTIIPPNGADYVDRSNVRPGMAVPGNPLNAAFASIGWGWGGGWSTPDYQHFSYNGK